MLNVLLLNRLAEKLNVSMDYFFNEQIESVSILKEFIQLSSKLLEDRNYNDFEYLYNLEKEKQQFISKDEKNYLTWIRPIILFHKYNQKNDVISLLDNTLHSINKIQLCI